MPLSLGGNGVISGIDWAGTGGGLAHITTSTFTGSSAVNIDNCFTSTYANYRILFQAICSAGNPTVTVRMRAASSDNTAASYTRRGYYGGVTAANVNTTGATSWSMAVLSTTSPGLIGMDLYSPALTAYTLYQASVYDSTGYGIFIQGEHQVSSPFDGFSLTPASGTMTGTVRVYGYIND